MGCCESGDLMAKGGVWVKIVQKWEECNNFKVLVNLKQGKHEQNNKEEVVN